MLSIMVSPQFNDDLVCSFINDDLVNILYFYSNIMAPLNAHSQYSFCVYTWNCRVLEIMTPMDMFIFAIFDRFLYMIICDCLNFLLVVSLVAKTCVYDLKYLSMISCKMNYSCLINVCILFIFKL